MSIAETDLTKHNSIEAYFQAKQSELSPNVLNLKRRVLTYFFVKTFPSLRPKDTTTEHVREFLDHLDDSGLKYSSKRRYLEALSSFFSYSLRDQDLDGINGNPPGIVLEEYPRF
ncbi:phage integrase N-terminal SAM-like domain-containing protein [Haloarcula japonica]|uniref:phage integrase N-terminal SAM-like domain-containing protein n=1 Tax=Haloarcula japonica TaxID=29282 RepID=UPI0039F6E904